MSYTISTKKTWGETQRDLTREFELWGISEWETNYPKGASWEGYKFQDEASRTVVLKYIKNGKEVVLKYGGQSRAIDNLRALYKTIQDMRMVEVRGMSEIYASAYKQIGSGTETKSMTNIMIEDPYGFLGVVKGTSLEAIEAVYRTMARKYHPDNKLEGSVEKMSRLNLAMEQIRSDYK